MKHIILALLLTACSTDQLAQNILYPTESVNKTKIPSPPTGFTEATVNGTHLWHTVSSKPVVIVYFHGNGENLGRLPPWLLTKLQSLGDVVVFDFPGFGKTPGKPSQATITASADSVMAWTRERYGKPVIAFGWSLGAAVAIQSKADRYVLVSAWTSVKDMAKNQSEFLAKGLSEDWLKANAWESVNVKLGKPSIVIHGKQDTLVPFAMGQVLSNAINAELVAIERSHNDILAVEEVWLNVRRFIQKP